MKKLLLVSLLLSSLFSPCKAELTTNQKSFLLAETQQLVEFMPTKFTWENSFLFLSHRRIIYPMIVIGFPASVLIPSLCAVAGPKETINVITDMHFSRQSYINALKGLKEIFTGQGTKLSLHNAYPIWGPLMLCAISEIGYRSSCKQKTILIKKLFLEIVANHASKEYQKILSNPEAEQFALAAATPLIEKRLRWL